MERQQVTTAMRPRPAARYHDVDLAGRIDGASPHALVGVLYDELAVALIVLERVTEAGDPAALAERHGRAATLLATLQASLDPVRGGDLAQALARIYGQMQRRLLAARNGETDAVREVLAGVRNLADAWKAIGQAA